VPTVRTRKVLTGANTQGADGWIAQRAGDAITQGAYDAIA
jgi:hypothetical protein